MTHNALQSLLQSFESLTILVLGDFFLDRYLMIDPDRAEPSIETGLEAHQVIEIRNSPGAAGTVTNNLCALGVGRVVTLGVIGQDGHGYDLRQALEAIRVDTSALITSSDRYTPTYTKPINTVTGDEMSRLDVKNRTATSDAIQDDLIGRLGELYDQVDGIIVLDQVQEADCGVVTSRVRDRLAELAAADDRPVLADSRSNIDRFNNVILKPNDDELEAMVSDIRAPESAAVNLANRKGRPVILTRGADGIIASDGEQSWTIPGIAVPDPIDIVGAGDSVSASVTSALAAGASLEDAAQLGVLVSSITIQQIGTTGTASPNQILQRSAKPWVIDDVQKEDGKM